MTATGTAPDWDALIDEHDQLTPGERSQLRFPVEHGPAGVRTGHKSPRISRPTPTPAPKPAIPQKPGKPLISADDVRPLLEAACELLRQLDGAWMMGKPVKGMMVKGRELRYNIEEVLK